MSKIRNELIEAFTSYRASVASFQQAFVNVSQEEIDEFYISECASLVDAANILGFKLPVASDTAHVVIHALDEEAPATPAPEVLATPAPEAPALIPEFDALAFLQK